MKKTIKRESNGWAWTWYDGDIAICAGWSAGTKREAECEAYYQLVEYQKNLKTKS